MRPEAGTVWPEQLGVASAQFLLGSAAGAAMLRTVLRACRARRRDILAGRSHPMAADVEAGLKNP